MFFDNDSRIPTVECGLLIAFVAVLTTVFVATRDGNNSHHLEGAFRSSIERVWDASVKREEQVRISGFSTSLAVIIPTPSGNVVVAPQINRVDCENLLRKPPAHVSAAVFLPGQGVPFPTAETMPTLYVPGTLSPDVSCISGGTMIMRVAKPLP